MGLNVHNNSDKTTCFPPWLSNHVFYKENICETDLSGVETIAQVSEIHSGESIITLSDCE